MKRAITHGSLVLCALTFLTTAAFSVADPITADRTAETPPSPATPENPGSVSEGLGNSPFSASWSLMVASRYIFQGFDYSDGKAVLNPELDLAAGPVSVKIWANHNLDSGFSDEFDFSLLHEWSIKKLSMDAGYTYFRYPHREGWDPSQELFFDLSGEGWLNPSLSVHYDFDAGTGTYSTLGLSHSINTSLGTASIGTKLFYQGSYYEMTGIPAFEANVNLSRDFGKFSVTPSVSRFLTWENGDFRASSAVPAHWLFSLQVGRGI